MEFDPSLTNTINIVKNKIKNQNLAGLNERNTDRVFITPIMEAIGWDLSNLGEVTEGYRPDNTPQASEITYAFSYGQNILLLLEIKPLFSPLNDIKGLSKVFFTAKNSSAKILGVTNGYDWIIYQTDTEPAQPILITNLDDSDVEMKLSLLSKEKLIAGDIFNSYQEIVPVTNLNDDCKRIQRGYKVTNETHDTIVKLKNQIMSSRLVCDQQISNNSIVENLLEVFFASLKHFNSKEISNETILKRRMEEALKKHLLNS